MSRISELNDNFRLTLQGGRVVYSEGVSALPIDIAAAALRRVRAFTAFTADNDPRGEHDVGSIEEGGYLFNWKIDYCDTSLSQRSPDPADPSITVRVLTLMLAEEC